MASRRVFGGRSVVSSFAPCGRRCRRRRRMRGAPGNANASLRWNTPHPSRCCAPIHLLPQGEKEETTLRSPFVPIFLGDCPWPRYLWRVTVEPRLADQNATVALPAPFLRWFGEKGWSPRAHQIELLAKA